MDKMSDYKSSPKEEAQEIVKQELTTAEEKLKEMNVPATAENLLLMFSTGVQQMLVKHLTNIRAILDGVEKREKELLYWIGQVSLMITALQAYQEGLDLKNEKFLEEAKRLFTEKCESLTKINYN
jgi:hypothetical protein